MRIAIPLIGQSYEHRSEDLSAQALKNWYPEYNKEAQAVISLQPFAGFRPFADFSGNSSGAFVLNEKLYAVFDRRLWRIDEAGEKTFIGFIEGEGLISSIASGFEAVIVREGFVYRLDAQTEALTLADDADFESPTFVAYLNSQAIYNGSENRFTVSNAGSLTEINGLNYATAESNGDPLVRPEVFSDTLYLFGTRTIEPWYNSGVGNPPFDKIQGSVIQRGLLAPHSVSSNQFAIYFLGDDNAVYRLSGSQLSTPLTTIPISQSIAGSKNRFKAVGQCLDYDGQHFYILSIPDERTWVYCEESASWFELTLGYNQNPFVVNSAISVYGKNYISFDSGLYEVTPEYFNQLIRVRSSSPVSAGLLGSQNEGLLLQYQSLEIIAKIIPRADTNPTLSLDYSDDNGRTWSPPRDLQIGRLGNYTYRFKGRQLGSAYERVFRVSYSDESFCSIQNAVAEVEIGIP